MAERKVPYEFLARWDAQGNLAAAHVGFRSFVSRADGSEMELVEPVMAVDIGAGAGFPLADILDDLHVSALARVEQLAADKAALEAAMTSQKGRLDEALATVTQVSDANAELQRQVAALQAPPPRIIVP